jgi:carbon storage regulator
MDRRSDMLVVSRKEGEEVVIGDPGSPLGVVRVASVKGERVRLAFDFPRHIKVYRRELAEEILHTGQQSAVVGTIKPAAAVNP